MVKGAERSRESVRNGYKREKHPKITFSESQNASSNKYTSKLWKPIGAEDGTRTRDPNLGKVMLYQLSYSRKIFLSVVRRERLELSRLGH